MESKSVSSLNWKEMVEPIKLNIGCGDRHWKGFVNCDIWYDGMREPDLVCDIKNIAAPSDIADEIHAIHVIEHLYRWETTAYLKEWVRILKPGGRLIIECPDLNKIALVLYNYLNADKPEKRILHDGREVDVIQDCKSGLYGDQKTTEPGMVHKWCFQRSELIDLMLDNGCFKVSSPQPKFHRHFRDMRLEGVKQ